MGENRMKIKKDMEVTVMLVEEICRRCHIKGPFYEAVRKISLNGGEQWT